LRPLAPGGSQISIVHDPVTADVRVALDLSFVTAFQPPFLPFLWP
jgi:hypothetical protein